MRMLYISYGSNNKKTEEYIRKLTPSTKKSIENSLYDIGRENVIYARSLFDLPKTGMFYRVNGKVFQASAPGEPPANRSGQTSDSIAYVVRGTSEVVLGHRKIPGRAPIGGFLEYGTKHMAPRPHLTRTKAYRATDSMKIMRRYISLSFKR